ncbi:MAG: hypothetical protein ACK4LQ_09625 [Pararhodobacter sp.]
MRNLAPPFVTLIAALSLALALLGQGYAQARPAAGQAMLHEVLICAAEGAVRILINEAGEPATPAPAPAHCAPYLCVDCLLFPALAALAEPSAMQRAVCADRRAAPPAAPVLTHTRALTARPRAPPLHS